MTSCRESCRELGNYQLGNGEDFCTMGWNESGVNLHKFPKETKDSRLLSVSMLRTSVLCDRLLSLSNTRQSSNSLNLQTKIQLPEPNNQ